MAENWTVRGTELKTNLSLDFSKLTLRQRLALFLLPFYILLGKSFNKRVS